MPRGPAFRMLFLEPQVKYIVQEYIGKHGAEITTLRRTSLCCNKLTRIHVTCFEEPFDKQKKARIDDPNIAGISASRRETHCQRNV